MSATTDDSIRVCPHCGEQNWRPTGLASLLVRRHQQNMCSMCAGALDGTPRTAFDKFAGYLNYSVYYGFNALAWAVILILPAVAFASWQLEAPAGRYLVIVAAGLGAIVGIVRARAAHLRREILRKRKRA